MLSNDNIEQVVQAIYIVEGGNKTHHPYGILQHYKHTTPHNACFNTVNHFSISHHIKQVDRHFIYILADTYCPLSSDPVGNKNWKTNMVKILHIH